MILDTCALLWLAQGGGELSAVALAQIEATPIVHVLAISGFEVALKYRQNKLTLPYAPAKWFSMAMEHHQLSEYPISMTIAIRAAQLPPLHRDPCDRFIIAAALENHWPVITTDSQIAAYGVTIIS